MPEHREKSDSNTALCLECIKLIKAKLSQLNKARSEDVLQRALYLALSGINKKFKENRTSLKGIANTILGEKDFTSLKDVAGLYIKGLQKVLDGRLKGVQFRTYLKEKMGIPLDEEDAASRNSDTAEYECVDTLKSLEGAIGKMSIELEVSKNGMSAAGLGFTFKFQTSIPTLNTRWVQFIARGVSLDGEYQGGQNKFGESLGGFYRLSNFDKTDEICWHLDKATTGDVPYYDEIHTHLPKAEGNIPTFDQPTGWSKNFEFENTDLNMNDLLTAFIASGRPIRSVAYFCSYLIDESSQKVLGKAELQIEWDLNKLQSSNVGKDFIGNITFGKQETEDGPERSTGVLSPKEFSFTSDIAPVHEDIIRAMYPGFLANPS